MKNSLVFYVSGHGFGHATRQLEVINVLARRRPDLPIVVRTSAPRWLFDREARAPLGFEAVHTDSGVAQIDSLHPDEDQTARDAGSFYRTFGDRVTQEAALLRARGASLVVGDVPPVAFAAAARAGIPSIAVANFTWDWIYAAYPAFERFAPGVIDSIRDAYALTTRALRLPFHGGFETMTAVVEDIPFIARSSHRDPAVTRQLLGVPSGRLLVLASFGEDGPGVGSLPMRALNEAGELTVVAPARVVPHGLRYEDIVAAADVVISKPGYGIVSECVANDTPLLYVSRGRFREQDVFLAEMPRVLRCRLLSQEDLLAGRWSADIQALLQQKRPSACPRVDGAEVAADHILAMSTL